MTHPDLEARLNDYLDGALSAPLHASTEAHLEGCEACRIEVDRLRDLLGKAARLPRRMEPPRDLWADIATQLDTAESRAWTWWDRRYVLAAAAVLLVVFSSAVTTLIITGRGGAGGDRFGGLPPEVRHAAVAYHEAATELEEVLEAARNRLAPQTIQIVERNLRIIDTAIEEARAALTSDPASRETMEALARRYQDRVDLLQHVSRLLAKS